MMDQLTHAAIIFNHYYQYAREVPYNEEWVNKPGHFSDAIVGVHAPVLAKGERVRSVNSNGFRILIIGTGGMNIVICEGFYKTRNTFCLRAHPTMFSMVSDIRLPLSVDGIELLFKRIAEYEPLKGNNNDVSL